MATNKEIPPAARKNTGVMDTRYENPFNQLLIAK
jgi:hypothetical protein